MRRLAAWFRSHPLTTGFLLLIGCAVGVHFFANWRAEVRWQRYCTEARARGVKLTLADFAPPEIPDAENFAALPMMRAAFSGGTQAAFKLPRAAGGDPPHHNSAKGERIDFAAWAKFFHDAGFIRETTDSAPRDVLLALDHYAPEFKEWSGWRSRPHCQFPIQLNASGMPEFPAFGTFANACYLFTLRMHAHLAAGDSPSALADFQDALQAYRALESQPALITTVLRLGLLRVLCSNLGGTLDHPAWAETELRRIQADLAALNCLRDFREGLAGERVFGNSYYERLVRSPAERRNLAPFIIGPSSTWWHSTAALLIPGRVFRDNQLRQNQHLDEELAKVSADARRYDATRPVPSGPDAIQGYADDLYFSIFKLFALTAEPVAEMSISLQTSLDQARLAIALERFRLARGVFPEQLADLVPEFIEEVPVDPYSQHPMIYRRKEGGTFLLYGVGKDGKDDGGVADPKLGSESKQRDDIWLYAPPAR